MRDMKMSLVLIKRALGWLVCSAVLALGQVPQSAPVLVTPVNGAVDVPHDQQFCWYPVSGAAAYHLEIRKQKPYPDIVYRGSGITSGAMICWTTDSLEYSRNYVWFV